MTDYAEFLSYINLYEKLFCVINSGTVGHFLLVHLHTLNPVT